LPKKTLSEVKQNNCEMLVQVKENQPSLKAACEEVCNSYNPQSRYQAKQIGHHRFEKRSCYVYTNTAILSRSIPSTWFKHVRSIVVVKRERYELNGGKYKPRKSIEDSYYICTKVLDAKQASMGIQHHWRIENSNNYVRDETMREDYSRIRKNSDRMVVLRSFALNILRKNSIENIKQELYKNALNINHITNYNFL
jgi:predicted transposase YbfD/YdcC